jgi:hypothetical protein
MSIQIDDLIDLFWKLWILWPASTSGPWFSSGRDVRSNGSGTFWTRFTPRTLSSKRQHYKCSPVMSCALQRIAWANPWAQNCSSAPFVRVVRFAPGSHYCEPREQVMVLMDHHGLYGNIWEVPWLSIAASRL